MKYIKQYILPEKTDKKWALQMLLSLLLPAFVLLTQPIGLSWQQAFVVADIVLPYRLAISFRANDDWNKQ